MAGFQVPISPGKASQQLTGSTVAAGSTIYNNSLDTEVWVSSNQSVQPGPGTGYRIGPLGSIEWHGGQVWAILPATATSVVILTISNDLRNPQNPVDVGIAVAEALALAGIPVTINATYIGSGNIVSRLLAPATVIDCQGFATIELILKLINLGQSQGNLVITWTTAPNGGQTLNSQYIPFAGANSTPIVLNMPVQSRYLNLDIVDAPTANYNINYAALGSNRQIEKLTQIPYANPQQVSVTGFATGNTNLGFLASSGLVDCYIVANTTLQPFLMAWNRGISLSGSVPSVWAWAKQADFSGGAGSWQLSVHGLIVPKGYIGVIVGFTGPEPGSVQATFTDAAI